MPPLGFATRVAENIPSHHIESHLQRVLTGVQQHCVEDTALPSRQDMLCREQHS
jgi:hypothetical protein